MLENIQRAAIFLMFVAGCPLLILFEVVGLSVRSWKNQGWRLNFIDGALFLLGILVIFLWFRVFWGAFGGF